MHEVQRAGGRIRRYVRPASLDAAAELLAQHPGATVVAGATDLLVELDRGSRSDIEVLVDISAIEGLDRIQLVDGELLLGPMVTHNQAATHAQVVAQATALAQACAEVGSPQLRNRATVVGNVVTASPANDTISALLALDAVVELRTGRSEARRRVPIAEFITGFREVDLRPGELVAGLRVPLSGLDRRSLFAKVGLRRSQAISVVHAAISLELTEDGVCQSAAIALGSVAPTVVRVAGAEALLRGRGLDEAVVNEVAIAARDAVTPIDDLRATAGYRSDLVEVTVRRMLEVLEGSTARDVMARPTLRGATDGSFSSPGPVDLDGDASEIEVEVNGVTHRAAGAGTTLLDWLRERRHDQRWLTGTKEGCAEGECGACTVHLDGIATLSCLVPSGRAAGTEVTTVEGLGNSDDVDAIQRSFIDCGAVQCGFCTPGFVMAAASLRAEIPEPTEAEVRHGLSGNLCRCTGYEAIVSAVRGPEPA